MGFHVVILNAEAEHGKNCLPKGDSVTRNSCTGLMYRRILVPDLLQLKFKYPINTDHQVNWPIEYQNTLPPKKRNCLFVQLEIVKIGE